MSDNLKPPRPGPLSVEGGFFTIPVIGIIVLCVLVFTLARCLP